MNTQSTNLG